MSSWPRFSLAVVFFLSICLAAVNVFAQEDDVAPQEAPFVQEENEFEETSPPPSQEKGTQRLRDPSEPIAITKDGAYIYKTNDDRSFNQTGSFRLGSIEAPKITAADGTNFQTMYSGDQHPVVMFDYEWQPLTSFGKLGVQAGLGFMYASGQGRFVSNDPSLNGQEAKERYTFLAIPLSAGFIYRLEFLTRQWLAPYFSGGGTYVAVSEFRDDGKSPSLMGTPGAYGAAGAMLNLSALDRETAFILNSEYGIANLWLSLEFRYLKTFTEDLDFSSHILSAGVSVDY